MNPTQEPQETSKPTDAEIVQGGSEVLIKFNGTAGAPDAVLRPVFVAIIPSRSLVSLALAWGNEASEILIYTKRRTTTAAELEEAEKFVDALHPDGWDAIIQEGRRLNLFNFARFVSRRRQALGTINGQSEGAEDRALKLVLESPAGMEMLAKLIGSQSLSPKP